MKLKDATPEQIKNVDKLLNFYILQREELKINGILELTSGEEFLLFGIVTNSPYADDETPIRGYSLYALPLSTPDEERLDVHYIPKVLLSPRPTDVGSVWYPFYKVVRDHVAKTYRELESESLSCIEFNEIRTGRHKAKGLGSYMLSLALAECQQACLKKDMVITHVFGEVIIDDENSLKKVRRFYRRNGFRWSYNCFYKII
jgi:hypothetical protein